MENETDLQGPHPPDSIETQIRALDGVFSSQASTDYTIYTGAANRETYINYMREYLSPEYRSGMDLGSLVDTTPGRTITLTRGFIPSQWDVEYIETKETNPEQLSFFDGLKLTKETKPNLNE